MRNILDATPKSVKDELYPHLRAILDAPDIGTARLLLNQTLEAFKKKAPRAMQVLEMGFDDVTAVLVLPEKYRRRLRTTNGVERLNEEIRRRERVIRIFPNRESIVRLVGALLMELDISRKFCDGVLHILLLDDSISSTAACGFMQPASRIASLASSMAPEKLRALKSD